MPAPEEIQRLRDIERKLDHQHEMLHWVAAVLADVARNLSGGMTPEEVAQITARLKTQAEKLEGIAKEPAPIK